MPQAGGIRNGLVFCSYTVMLIQISKLEPMIIAGHNCPNVPRGLCTAKFLCVT